MGAWLLSCALVLSLVVASIDGRLGERVRQKASVGDSAQRAAQMVTLVNAINDHLYHTPQTQGPVSLAVLGLTFTPDPRIEHVLQDGRLSVLPRGVGAGDGLAPTYPAFRPDLYRDEWPPADAGG